MLNLAKNIAVAAILADLGALRASDIIERRLAILTKLGEDKRNTVAWQDACYESAAFGRAISARTYHLRSTITVCA